LNRKGFEDDQAQGTHRSQEAGEVENTSAGETGRRSIQAPGQ